MRIARRVAKNEIADELHSGSFDDTDQRRKRLPTLLRVLVFIDVIPIQPSVRIQGVIIEVRGNAHMILRRIHGAALSFDVDLAGGWIGDM